MIAERFSIGYHFPMLGYLVDILSVVNSSHADFCQDHWRKWTKFSPAHPMD